MDGWVRAWKEKDWKNGIEMIWGYGIWMSYGSRYKV